VVSVDVQNLGAGEKIMKRMLRKYVRWEWSALIWVWVGGRGGLVQKSDDKRMRSAAFV